MNEILSKLTGTQALVVLERLAATDVGMARTIEAAAKRVLAAVDVDETADEVFDALDTIAVEDCWDMAGSHRHGYTSTEDAAVELIEEELRPFVDQAERYHALRMLDNTRKPRIYPLRFSVSVTKPLILKFIG